MENDLLEKLIPVSEIVKRSGVGYHTLRYYTKIGLLPYMSRRLPYPDAPSTVGHYPEKVLESLKKIAELKKQGWDNGRIKKELENPQIVPSAAITPEPATPIPVLPPLLPPPPPPSPTPPSLDPIILGEERKHNELLSQISHFLTNMIRVPLPAHEPILAKIASHTLTLALVFGTIAILALGFSDLTRERIQRIFGGFWDQYVERIVPGNFLGIAQIADPIVDTNDVLEYSEFDLTRWLHSKIPFLFDTGRFLGTLFFGETGDYFISPLGVASLKDLRAVAIVADSLEAKEGIFGSIKVDSLNVENLTVSGTTTGVTGTGGGGGGIATGGDADTLEGQGGDYYLNWSNFTGTPVILSSLDGVSNNEGNIDLIAGANIVITPDDGANTITITSIAGSDADTLDGLDSLQFLRSNTSDSFTAGTLTIADGTTLTVNSTAINLGNAVTDLVIFNGAIDSDIIPSLNAQYDIGSAGVRWDIGYFDEIVVNTLSAGASDISGTISSDFSINTDNASADIQDATLTFIRGTSSPNAVLRWDATLDRYRFESFPVYFDSNLISASTVEGTQLISTVATGTAPLTVASTTLVANLNADLFDDLNSDQFLRSDTDDSYTGTGTLTTDSGTTVDINGTLAWGGATVTEALDMNASIISNIGNDGTDFDTGGGLTLAGDLTVSGGEIFLTPVASSGSTTEGTVYYDSDNDKLFVYANGAFARLATDMTKYTATDAALANAGYVEIAHNQSTNDLSLTAWYYDSLLGQWRTIENFTTTKDLDLWSEFNPLFTQKLKTASVKLQFKEDNLGTGADGAITVSTNTNINATSLIAGRACADGGDAVYYNITALTSTNATLTGPPSSGCLNVGDEVLLINLQGTNSAFGNTGNYETLRVQSVSSNVVTFTNSKTKFYGDGASDDTNLGTAQGTQRVLLQRVPNYTSVTVNTTINFFPSTWDGIKGGVMFFRATGAVSVNGTGTINANGVGHRGGTGGAAAGAAPNGDGGDGGEAFCGIGGAGGATNGSNGAAGGGAGYENAAYDGGDGSCGGGGGSGTNTGLGSATQGGAGGGGHNIAGGGGAGYGTFGTSPASRSGGTSSGQNGGTNSSGNGGYGTYTTGGGGGTYGDANLTKLYFGSAGGGGGDYNTAFATTGGAGGAGGGIIYISADSVAVSGTISSTAVAGVSATSGCDAGGEYAGGGGGGAGGSIKIVGNSLTLGASKVTSTGGAGGSGCESGTPGATNQGGVGGSGRVAVKYASSISGSTDPAYTSATFEYNPYAVYVSNEIHTPGTTAFNTISWTENLDTNGKIELQTRSGNTIDSTDGTWEGWRPVVSGTNTLMLENANTHTNWTGTNATVAEGDVARNVDYFEDEDVSNSGDLAKVTATAANGYAEATISSTDISGYDYLTVWIRSGARGDVLTLGFGEAAATEQTKTFYIDKVESWQKIYWDIRNVAAGSRNGVTKLRITSITNGNTIWFDNVTADKYLVTSGGSTITSSPNNYIQYRAVLSTTNVLNSPVLSKVRINLTNPNGTFTIDADRVRSPFDVADSQSTLRIDPLKLEYNKFSLGTGADGAITVSSSTNINATSLIVGRSCADGGDAVNYSATALTSTSATLSTTPSAGCLAVGDEILLINVAGTNSALGNVGNYETLRVLSVVTNTVNFTTAKTKFYGDGASDDNNLGTAEGTQRVMLQRVPNYTSVTVNTAINFFPATWNGTKNGVMFFRATGAVAVNGTGTINANAIGHRGGAGGVASGAAPNGGGGNGGEAFCGIGGTGASGAGNGGSGAAGGAIGHENVAYSGGNGSCGGGGGTSIAGAGLGSATQGGSGGGGGNIGGGGGAGYGTFGTSPAARGGGAAGQNGGTNSSGNGGVDTGNFYVTGGGGGTYGDANLTKLYFGAAGGGGGDYNNTGPTAGAGGASGGIVYIAADSVTVSGTISSNAANGSPTSSGTSCDGAGEYAGGGGGGAGGSIKIVGNNLTLGASKVLASGGSGGNGCENGSFGATNIGGVGGSGRIAVYNAGTISGSTSPTYIVDSSVADFNPYKVFTSKEIATPGAVSLDTIAWTENLPAGTEIRFQTRSGATSNSLDGTWQEWRPQGIVLESADTHTNWVGTNATVAEGDVTRDVNYFEDEDEPTVTNITKITSSTNGGYAEATPVGSPVDISVRRYLAFWIRASIAGSSLRFGFGETVATEREESITIYTANVWQKYYWDISDVPAANRDAVTKLRLTNLTTASNTIYLDNVFSDVYLTDNAGSAITSTANSYIQYRALLTTTSILNTPTLSEVRINYTDGSGSKTIDDHLANQNNVDEYDLTGRLAITEYELDDFKSIRLEIGLTNVTQQGDFDPGTGADGSVTVSSSTNINATNLVAGRSCLDGGDAVNYNVSSLTANTATIVSGTGPSTGCLNPGDEILLINLQGSNTAFGNTGNYETLHIQSIANNVVTFTSSKAKYYGNGASDDTNLGTTEGTQRVMLQRVPNYSTLTVNTGINFFPATWNGAKGGLMFFRASVSANINGTIHANAVGYAGGVGIAAGEATEDYGGYGGDSICGSGGVGGITSSTAGAAGAAGGGGGNLAGGNGYCGGGGGSGENVNSPGLGSTTSGGSGGGGGGIAGGGAGGNGGPGNAGGAYTSAGSNGGTNSSGNGGAVGRGSGGGGGTYGDSNLTKLFFGSGGGGGGGYNGTSGNGGKGGGIIYISADSTTVSGNLQSNGSSGSSSSCAGAGDYGGGGGGGAGGSIKLVGNSINVGTSKTIASAGSGGTGCINGVAGTTNGGTGGVGRIATYYASTVSGSSSPSAELASTASNNYSLIISDEIPTPNAVGYTPLTWLADLNTYGMVQLQTRTGKSNNSTDGTWESWKPSTATTNTLMLDNANTHTNWVANDPALLTVADGDVTRDVDYYEDEDEPTAGNLTKLTVGANADTYAERIIGTTDLNPYDYLTLWVRSSVTGSMIKLGFGETAATEHEESFHIDTVNTWQKIYWDISDIPDHERDGVRNFRITAPGTSYTLYFDNLTTDRYLTDPNASFITSTPNDYIQYRAILTTSNTGYRPTLHNVNFNYETGYKTVQVDNNNVRLYNYTGATQNVRLEAIVFGADLAEWYPTSDLSIEAGDVIAIAGEKDDAGVPKIQKATVTSDPKIMGIISTKAGVELGIPREDRRLVGLAGRVPVKIAPDSPAITAGDLLTSSGTYPGMAQKLAKPGFSVAKALEDWSPDSGVGRIDAFLAVSWGDPGVVVDDEGDAAEVVDSSESTVQSGETETSELQPTDSELPATNDELPATDSPTDTLEQPKEPITQKIITPQIEADEGIFLTLKVAVEAIFEKITVKVAEIASAFIDNLTIKKLTVEGETLGESVLPAGEVQILITNSMITDKSRVFVTPKVAIAVPLAVIELKPEESFTVAISQPQDVDIPFSWWVVEGQLTTGGENN